MILILKLNTISFLIPVDWIQIIAYHTVFVCFAFDLVSLAVMGMFVDAHFIVASQTQHAIRWLFNQIDPTTQSIDQHEIQINPFTRISIVGNSLDEKKDRDNKHLFNVSFRCRFIPPAMRSKWAKSDLLKFSDQEQIQRNKTTKQMNESQLSDARGVKGLIYCNYRYEIEWQCVDYLNSSSICFWINYVQQPFIEIKWRVTALVCYLLLAAQKLLKIRYSLRTGHIRYLEE